MENYIYLKHYRILNYDNTYKVQIKLCNGIFSFLPLWGQLTPMLSDSNCIFNSFDAAKIAAIKYLNENAKHKWNIVKCYKE